MKPGTVSSLPSTSGAHGGAGGRNLPKQYSRGKITVRNDQICGVKCADEDH